MNIDMEWYGDIDSVSWRFLGDDPAWIILGIISSLQEAGPKLATTCRSLQWIALRQNRQP